MSQRSRSTRNRNFWSFENTCTCPHASHRQSTKSYLCHPFHFPPLRNAAKRKSSLSLSHPFANFPSERSRQGRLRYPYFEKICSTFPVNAADRNGYPIKFFHLEMWHFPSERIQHSRKVNGVVPLHNRPRDQTQQSQGACKPQRANGSGKRPRQLFRKVQNTMARNG